MIYLISPFGKLYRQHGHPNLRTRHLVSRCQNFGRVPDTRQFFIFGLHWHFCPPVRAHAYPSSRTYIYKVLSNYEIRMEVISKLTAIDAFLVPNLVKAFPEEDVLPNRHILKPCVLTHIGNWSSDQNLFIRDYCL